MLKLAAVMVAVGFVTLGLNPDSNTVEASTVDDSDFPGEIGELPEGLAGLTAVRNETSGIIYLFGGENTAVGVDSGDRRHSQIDTCQYTTLSPGDDDDNWGEDDSPGTLDGSVSLNGIAEPVDDLCDGYLPDGSDSPFDVNRTYNTTLADEACLLVFADCPLNPWVDYGDQETSYSPHVYAYDPNAAVGSKLIVVDGADFPDGGAGWNSAVWYGGSAYIFGGYHVDVVSEHTDNIYKFTPGPTSTTGTTEILSEKLPYAAHGIAACKIGDKAYLFGGKEGPLGYTIDPAGFYDQYHNDTFIFDLATETIDTATITATLPQAAYGHACAYDADDTTIVLLGGKFHGEEAWANTTLHFDVGTQTFTRHTPVRETNGGSSEYGDFGNEVYRQGTHMAAFYNDVTGTVHVAGGYGYYLVHRTHDRNQCNDPGENACIEYRVGPYPWISHYNTAAQTGLDDEGLLSDAVFGAAAVYDPSSGYAYIFGGKAGRGDTHSTQIVRFQTHVVDFDITKELSTDDYGTSFYSGPQHPYYVALNNSHVATFSFNVTYTGAKDTILDASIVATNGWLAAPCTESIDTSVTTFPYEMSCVLDPSAAGVTAGATTLTATVTAAEEPDMVRTSSADVVIPITIRSGLNQFTGNYTISDPVIINASLYYADGSPAANVNLRIRENYESRDQAGRSSDPRSTAAMPIGFVADNEYIVTTDADGEILLNIGNPRKNPNDDFEGGWWFSSLHAQMPGAHELRFNIQHAGYKKTVCNSVDISDNEQTCRNRNGIAPDALYPWNFYGMYTGYRVYDGETGFYLA